MDSDKPDIPKETFLPIARHEAGHWIISRILGFKSGRISISIKFINGQWNYEGGSEIILYKSLSNEKEIIDYLEKRLIILFSGIFAEYLIDGKVNKELAISFLDTKAKIDCEKISELKKLLRNIKYKDSSLNSKEEIELQLKTIDDDIINQSICHVEHECYMINELSENLLRNSKCIDNEYFLEESDIKKIESVKVRFF